MEVYRTCHFGKAADNLFVTQSTVSARIRQLELELGVSLFYRDRNNIQLTPAGRKFLKHVESILNIWNRARFDINIQEEGKIPFVIGAVSSLWDIFLLKLLASIRIEFPELSIIGEALSTDSLIRQLLDQSIDVGFTYDFPQTNELSIQEFFSFNLIMVSSHKNISVQQAFESGYIYVNWGTSFMVIHTKNFPEITVPDLSLNMGHTALEYIRNYGGSAYFPEPMVRDDLQKGSLYKIGGAPEINRKSFVVYRENSAKKEFVEKLLSHKFQNQ